MNTELYRNSNLVLYKLLTGLLTPLVIGLFAWTFHMNARVAVLETKEVLSSGPIQQLTERIKRVEGQLENIQQILLRRP